MPNNDVLPNFDFIAPYSLVQCVAKLQKLEQHQIYFSSGRTNEGIRTEVDIWMPDAESYQFEMKRVMRWLLLVMIQGKLIFHNSNQTQISYTLEYYWRETMLIGSIVWIVLATVIFSIPEVSWANPTTIFLILILGICEFLLIFFTKRAGANFVQRQLRYILRPEQNDITL